MAAKGTESKNAIWDKMLEVYPDAFWEETGKILRIPMDENGTRVEIKVSLTAAKNNLKDDAAASAFTSAPPQKDNINSNESIEVTEEEKENVAKLIKSLNF